MTSRDLVTREDTIEGSTRVVDMGLRRPEGAELIAGALSSAMRREANAVKPWPDVTPDQGFDSGNRSGTYIGGAQSPKLWPLTVPSGLNVIEATLP